MFCIILQVDALCFLNFFPFPRNVKSLIIIIINEGFTAASIHTGKLIDTVHETEPVQVFSVCLPQIKISMINLSFNYTFN